MKDFVFNTKEILRGLPYLALFFGSLYGLFSVSNQKAITLFAVVGLLIAVAHIANYKPKKQQKDQSALSNWKPLPKGPYASKSRNGSDEKNTL